MMQAHASKHVSISVGASLQKNSGLKEVMLGQSSCSRVLLKCSTHIHVRTHMHSLT